MNSLIVAPTRARIALAFFFAIAVLLIASASASATVNTVRYASPTGTGPVSTCAEADPCSLADATNSSYTLDGDEVILAPGTYALGALEFVISDAINLHGTGPASATKLVSTAPTYMRALSLDNGASLSNLELEAVSGFGVHDGSLTNVVAKSSQGLSCLLSGPATLVNTACTTAAYGAAAIVIGDQTPNTVILKNVTSVSTGTQGMGIRCVMQPGNGTTTVNATNLISSGEYADVYVSTVSASGGACDINLQNSNYDVTSISGDGSITDLGGHQNAAPLFVNAAAGDLHQAAGSPTIDAGTPEAAGEPVDFDGDARTTGSAIDIGADEYVAAPPAPAPVPDAPTAEPPPPDTSIDSGPAARTRSTTAKFRFSSNETGVTFNCQLDDKPFKACTSPTTFKVKPGKHKLRVVATDAAGKADPVHAWHTWRVLRPR